MSSDRKPEKQAPAPTKEAAGGAGHVVKPENAAQRNNGPLAFAEVPRPAEAATIKK